MAGIGSFARSACYALATELRTPADVVVLARDPAKAADVAFVAAARAGPARCRRPSASPP